MNDIVPQEQIDVAGAMRNLMAVYDANYDLVSIGAYKSGTNPVLDEAIRKNSGINAFLQQKVEERLTYDESVALMRAAVGGS
jgi:flagellum-specific ATP synthase